MRSFGLLLALSIVACDDDGPPPAGGDAAIDVGPALDAALPDVGSDDAGSDDAGSPDVGATDAGDGADAVMAASCPPVGPFGTEEGEIAADVTLYDCEGNEVRLHELCDAQVSWLFEFADWCPPCRSFARSDLQDVWTTYSAMGVQAYMVVSEDADFAIADAADCAEIRDRYSLTMPVLFDPTGAVQTALDIDSNATNVIFDRGMRIRWKDKYAEDEVAGQLAAALSE